MLLRVVKGIRNSTLKLGLMAIDKICRNALPCNRQGAATDVECTLRDS